MVIFHSYVRLPGRVTRWWKGGESSRKSRGGCVVSSEVMQTIRRLVVICTDRMRL